MTGIEAFQDAIIELEQRRQFLEIPKSEVAGNPDCLEVFGRMGEIVQSDPSVTEFYAGAMRKYRKTKPDSVVSERRVLARRIELMDDLDLLTPRQAARIDTELQTGELVYTEAKSFFRLFKGLIEPTDIPKDRYRRTAVKQKATAISEIVPIAVEPQDDIAVSEPTAVIASETETVEEDQQVLGWEYDELVGAYQHHRQNKPLLRYRRDFRGFKSSKSLESLSSYNSNVTFGEDAYFYAQMRRFPLLDGLAHERKLKDKIEAGLAAHARMREEADPHAKAQLERTAIEGAGAYLTMYECNLRLVSHAAKRYPNVPTYSHADILSDGCTGLRRAIQKYDPAKGFKFSTYATGWINQAIQRRRSSVAYDVALPAHGYQRCREAARLLSGSAEDDIAPLSPSDVLELGYREYEIFAAQKLLSDHRYSLDTPVGDGHDAASMHDFLADEQINFDETLDELADIKAMGDILSGGDMHSQRALIILSLREGVIIDGIDYNQMITLPDMDPMSLGEVVMRVRTGSLNLILDQIAPVFGLTRERVRQILAQTQSEVLRSGAVSAIAERLMLTLDEKTDLIRYMAMEKYPNIQLINGKTAASSQKRAQNVVDLLHLLDTDYEVALTKTHTILESTYSHKPGTAEKIDRWLRVRFGMDVSPDGLPVAPKHTKAYSIQPEQARYADSTFLAVLAGVWGKVPQQLHAA